MVIARDAARWTRMGVPPIVKLLYRTHLVAPRSAWTIAPCRLRRKAPKWSSWRARPARSTLSVGHEVEGARHRQLADGRRVVLRAHSTAVERDERPQGQAPARARSPAEGGGGHEIGAPEVALR